MKNTIEGLLVSIAVMALPVICFAQASVVSAGPSLPIVASPIQMAAATGLGTVTPASQCMQSAVTNVNFTFDSSTSPATYTISYTCTFSTTGPVQQVDSVVVDGSGACFPSQSTADCKNDAMEKAESRCSTYCTTDR